MEDRRCFPVPVIIIWYRIIFSHCPPGRLGVASGRKLEVGGLGASSSTEALVMIKESLCFSLILLNAAVEGPLRRDVTAPPHLIPHVYHDGVQNAESAESSRKKGYPKHDPEKGTPERLFTFFGSGLVEVG